MDEDALATLAWLLTALNYAIIAFLVPRILFQRRDPRGTLAWVLFVVLVPFLGLIAFWVLGHTRLRLRTWRRKDRLRRAAAVRQELPAPPAVPEAVLPVDATLFHLAQGLDPAGAPSDRNRVELLDQGPAIFAAMEEAIDRAAAHVHAEFYIWNRDATGARFRDALVRAARRGVAVRVLVDDVGARAARADFFRPLTEAGGEVRRFLPVSLLARRFSLNHRNHRKLLVTDGQVGFTGGINIGDEYAGLGPPWYDAQVRLEGPAVHRLQAVFCQDWFRAGGEDLARPELFPPPLPHPSGAWVQILESGPDLPIHTIHALTVAILGRAAERVRLVSPYFVPDPATSLALRTAAIQGADVRLILPGETDHPLVSHAARTFYDELLEAGVRIFETPDRFVHAKMFAVDGRLATVGSANLDERSQRLNFEVNAFVYGPELAGAVERACAALEAGATEIDRATFARRGWVQRWKEALARLLTPIL